MVRSDSPMARLLVLRSSRHAFLFSLQSIHEHAALSGSDSWGTASATASGVPEILH